MYQQSWSVESLSQEKSIGKSNAVFMFSPDKQFVMKTINKSESKALRALTFDFYQHLSSNPSSLLTSFYAHCRIKVDGVKLYCIVIQNAFHKTLKLNRVYDLKVLNNL